MLCIPTLGKLNRSVFLVVGDCGVFSSHRDHNLLFIIYWPFHSSSSAYFPIGEGLYCLDSCSKVGSNRGDQGTADRP